MKGSLPDQPEARRRILAAAERLFALKGYAATAVREITDEAGVNRALLYYYYEDKQSLYRAVLEEGTAEFDRMVERALSSDDSHSDRLARIVAGHLELIRTRPFLARVIHRCLLDGLQEEFGLRDKFSACVSRMEQFFRDGVETGAFRPMNPAIIARTFIGPTFVLALWRLTEGDVFAPEDLALEISTLLRRGLVAPAEA